MLYDADLQWDRVENMEVQRWVMWCWDWVLSDGNVGRGSEACTMITIPCILKLTDVGVAFSSSIHLVYNHLHYTILCNSRVHQGYSQRVQHLISFSDSLVIDISGPVLKYLLRVLLGCLFLRGQCVVQFLTQFHFLWARQFHILLLKIRFMRRD